MNLDSSAGAGKSHSRWWRAVSTGNPDESRAIREVRPNIAVTGEAARLGGVPGATDGTVLTARGGVPSVVYGPGGKWIAHQADEFVEVEDIVRCAEVFAEAARRFLNR